MNKIYSVIVLVGFMACKEQTSNQNQQQISFNTFPLLTKRPVMDNMTIRDIFAGNCTWKR